MLYRLAFNVVLLRLSAEAAHHIGMAVIRFLGAAGLLKLLPKVNAQTISAMGLQFSGPFGLAAGFDKNAVAVRALGELGFSHVEVGTVTMLPQPGNSKPRLFRLPKDRALINRMGFNNQGAAAIAKRLEKLRNRQGSLPIIGVNIGKSKATALEEASSDYEHSARLLAPFADYLAVNVSSPNTAGLRSLQEIEQLEPILRVVKQQSLGKPVLVKIAPDLADQDILEIAQLVKRLGLAGVIASNTTVSRSSLQTDSETLAMAGDGGLSGPVLKGRALEVLRLLRGELDSNFTIISVGGIENASDVSERLSAGANLTQGYTGFVYFGPLWARKINRAF